MTTPDRRVGGRQLARLLGDWRGQDAAYAGLASRIRLLVLDGRLPLHTRVPAERELADSLGISRTTVAAAYERLRTDGFLHSRRGSGTWTELPAPGHRGAVPQIGLSDELLDLAHAAPSAPEEALHAAADRAVAELARYLPTHGYDPLGLTPLRVAIADRYTARGAPTAPEQILVTAGAQAAFSLVLRLLTSPGERVLVDHPTYPNALDAITRCGCRALPIGLPSTGWDLETITDTLRRAAPRLAYLIPDHQNPTGRCMSTEQRQELVALAARTRTPLVIDETVAELTLDGPAPVPVAAFDTDGVVLTTGSASKTFWGGLRIGWLRAPVAMIQRLVATRGSVDLASPVLEQLIVADLLANLDGVLPLRIADLRVRRDHLHGLIAAQLPSWRSEPPPGGLSLWIDLGAPRSSAIAVAAERHGLRLAAGPRFGLDGAFEANLRLPYTLPLPQLDTAFERLVAAAASVGDETVPVAPIAAVV